MFPLLTTEVEVTSAAEFKVVSNASSPFAFFTTSFALGPTVESMVVSVPDFSASSSIATSLAAVSLGPAVMGLDRVDPPGPLACWAGCDPLSEHSGGRGWVWHFTVGG